MSKLSAVAIHAPAVHAVPRFFTRLFAKRAAKPGEHFGAPGQGSSTVIASATVAVLLLLWVVVSNSGLVKPIFLPTPQAVFAKFIQVATEGFAGATLLQHTTTSLGRVFGAFALACLTAIPIGVMMGVSRVARGVFDPPSSSTGRCRRSLTCRWSSSGSASASFPRST